ncbi:hypothetical protein CDAR_88901 [Caerostris darwini]|uniref:Uncharacterized protein n=1 Tax=Caerostris darwini TaxID=1538125 RepID=A0AAV4UZ52_9ARAC|nr:hypothetical protein CDAR_88901 [Caerostris darwini]
MPKNFKLRWGIWWITFRTNTRFPKESYLETSQPFYYFPIHTLNLLQNQFISFRRTSIFLATLKKRTSSCFSIVDGGYILPPRGVGIKKITRDKDLIKCQQSARCVLLSHGHQWTPFLSSPIDAGGAKVISGTLGGGRGGTSPVCGIRECAEVFVFSSLSSDKYLGGRIIHVMY